MNYTNIAVELKAIFELVCGKQLMYIVIIRQPCGFHDLNIFMILKIFDHLLNMEDNVNNGRYVYKAVIY